MSTPLPDSADISMEATSWRPAGLAWNRVSLFAPASPVVAYRSHLDTLDCDLWCIQTSQHDVIYRANSHELNLLRPADLERAGRYRHDLDRRVFLARRLLVRGALSHYAGVAPAAWRFIDGPFGRPRIAGGCKHPEIDFNLSSSGEMAVCVISRDGLVGIDLEDLAGPDSSELAATILGAEEERVFRHVQPNQRKEAFLCYWTLKEAYVKACGVGLSIPIDQVCFDFTTADRIAVGFGRELSDDASSWEFLQHTIFDRYIVAIAKRR